MPRANPMDPVIFQQLFTGDNATNLLTAFMNDYFSTTKAVKVEEIIHLVSEQSSIPSVRIEVKRRNLARDRDIEMQILTKEHLGEDFQAYWGKILSDSLQGNKAADRVLKLYFLDFELFKNKEYKNDYHMYRPILGNNLERTSVEMEFFELPKIDKLSVRKMRSLWNDNPFLKWLVFLSPNGDPQLLKEAILLNEAIREAEEKLQEIGRNPA